MLAEYGQGHEIDDLCVLVYKRFFLLSLLIVNRKEKEILWRTSPSSDASVVHDDELIKTFTQGMFC